MNVQKKNIQHNTQHLDETLRFAIHKKFIFYLFIFLHASYFLIREPAKVLSLSIPYAVPYFCNLILIVF